MRSSRRLIAGARARAWPVTRISDICMVKASRFQKPLPQCCAIAVSPWPVASIAANSTISVSRMAKTKGEGRKRCTR